MRNIWLLAEPAQHEKLSQQLLACCEAMGCFPELRCFSRPEDMFETIACEVPDCVVSAMPGVAGLNAMEYLRRICPDCALIWVSDLDFSLQAFRLRADHFILGQPDDELLSEGLARCIENRRVNFEI